MIIRHLQPRIRIRGCASAAAWSPSLLTILLLFPLFAIPPAQAQIFTVLHAFTGHGDGESPSAGVFRDLSGNLYGVTGSGGSFDKGELFEVDTHGKETILHSFWGGDGFGPSGALIQDHTGTLYGATWNGGTPKGGGCFFGCGAAFKLDIARKETVVYAFSGGADGSGFGGQLVVQRRRRR